MTTFVARRFDTDQLVKVTLREECVASVLPVEQSPAGDASLPIVGPGLCDIQVNGYTGIWFSSESLTVNDVETVVHSYLKQGITRCLPTLITNSAAAIEHGLATIRAARDRSSLVRHVIAGCHIEGPWISSEDGPRGAHPVSHVRPADVAEFHRWQRVSGNLVRIVTLAPEVTNALTVTREIVHTGVLVSIGHTAATSDQIAAAIDAGATLGTHLGNGCAGMIPRHNNVFWSQLADDRLTCSIIADGWHVPAAMLNCILRCKSLDRLILTSDVSGFGGCPPGRYRTGEVEVDVLENGRLVVAGQTEFLAGSGATTGECVACLMSMCGISLQTAWPLASIRPTRLLGAQSEFLQEGKAANLTLFRLFESKPTTAAGKSHKWKYSAVATIVNGVVVAGHV